MGSVVAVIHARGGSVRVPLKNIRHLGGRPLITWVIESALASSCDRVIVSTDHDGIADIARQSGAEVPFKRPVEISGDVGSELVTQHAIRFHEAEHQEEVEYAVTIQPTTPFLSKNDIDGAINMMRAGEGFDSVFTASLISQRPEWMYYRNATGYAQKYIEGNGLIKKEEGNSKTLPKLWHPNGGAYVTSRKVLFEDGAIIGHRPGIYCMSDISSVDIDEELDFIVAEAILKIGKPVGDDF